MAATTIDIHHGGLRCRVDGPAGGPALVLSNSLGADLSMWEAQVPLLAARFRVVRHDTRGHGLSAVTPGPHSIEQLGLDVLALLDELHIPYASFCGVSMGGMTGMWLSLHAPERIARLVLANTAPKIGSPEMWDGRIGIVREGGMEAIAGAVLERWLTPPFRARAPAEVARLRAMLTATPAEGYAACCAAVRDADLRDAIARIRAPTLVIAGTHDTATTPAEGRAMVEQIPGARYIELDAAHLSNIEEPGLFAAEVLEFLGGGGR